MVAALTLLVLLFPARVRLHAAEAGIDLNDPVEQAYMKLLLQDEAAENQADAWIQEAKEAENPVSEATLNARIRQRFDEVKKAYEDFLGRNPAHVRARLAFGSFLNDWYGEREAVEQWEKARQLDPSNPAAWNNLANHYGHRGPVKKAFEYYAKAIELVPEEPVYLWNLATTVYMFRKDAREYYDITEEEVFNRSLDLYRKALKQDPDNFILASDYAQSYYGIRPWRIDEALGAWREALEIAPDEIERQGVYIHLARLEIKAEQFDQARKHLDQVTHEMYGGLKDRLRRNLIQAEEEAAGANSAKPPEDASAVETAR